MKVRTLPFARPSRVVLLALLSTAWGFADSPPLTSVASIDVSDLVEFEEQPEEVRDLIREALALTKKKLTYRFGSNSPKKGGMDCSGTVQCTLAMAGVEKVPRSSYAIYHWAREAGTLKSTKGVDSIDDPVFESLRPGDLLFWEGTYDTAKRDPPISHVMIFLGTLKEDGKGVVYGASDGRRYRGQSIYGVSVFDWTVPSAGSKSRFVAFGPVPGLIGDSSGEGNGSGDAPGDKPVSGGLKSVLDKVFRKRESSNP